MKDTTVGILIVHDHPWILVEIETSKASTISLDDAELLIKLLQNAVRQAKRLLEEC